MTKQELKQFLEMGIPNAMLKNRMRVVDVVYQKPELFSDLLDIVFEVDNKTSIKAAWVLELICIRDLDLLLPFIDKFTDNISKVKYHSAIRPTSKICMLLAQAYCTKKPNLTQAVLKDVHIDSCIEAGFDWLISDQKVAVKAYTMEALYLFGKDRDWVHPELDGIIRENMAYESCGYIARGKKILALINKE